MAKQKIDSISLTIFQNCGHFEFSNFLPQFTKHKIVYILTVEDFVKAFDVYVVQAL